MISVVILAHNEAEEIGGLLDDFSAFEGLELIVAEDASTDHTLTSCAHSRRTTAT